MPPPIAGPSIQPKHSRMADHLLAAPGVSFAPSLSAYSSLHGTIRSYQPILRKQTKHKQPPKLTPSEALAPIPASSTKTTTTTTELTLIPGSSITTTTTTTELTLVPNSSTPTTTTITTNKPKSWADLLRPSADHPQSNPSSKASNDLKNKHFIHQDRELLLPQKLKILREQDQPFHLIPRGLVNNGNICFANAILQVLLHCPPFFNLLKHLGRILTHDFRSKTPLLDAMIAFIHEFQTLDLTELPSILDSNGQLQLRQGDPFIAESVWLATKDNSRFDEMRRGQQEDAQEFLCFFLDSLHEELLCVAQKHDSLIIRPKHPHATSPVTPSRLEANEVLNSGEWHEVGARGQAAVTRSMDACPSPLTQLFDIMTRSVLHRSGQKDSVTFEPTNMLQLSIEHPSITDIEQALAHYSSPEVISDMLSKNGQRVSATKQVYIESFPPVLVLHLKRFHYNSQDGTIHKSNKAIRFGSRLKIPKVMRSPAQRTSPNGAEGEVEFALFAVVHHHGPHASGGHYTVSIRQPAVDNWVYIDDTHITPTNNPNLIVNGTTDESKKIKDVPKSIDPSPAHHNLAGTNGHHPVNGNSNHQQNGIKTPYLLFYTRL